MNLNNKHEDPITQVSSIVSQISGILPQAVYEHASESLNGTFFRFDAVSMMYLILMLMRSFNINLNDQMLNSCAYWSVAEFAQWIDLNSSKKRYENNG